MTVNDPTERETVDRNWLVLEYPRNPQLRLDASQIDHLSADSDLLFFDIEDLQISLKIAGGSATAISIADLLSRYTRATPITEEEVYDHAKRQLDQLTRGSVLHSSMVFVGDKPVQVDGQMLRIGAFTLPIYDAIQLGRNRESINLPDRSRFQAGLALLVVAASERQDDLEQLRRRIAAYEARTNR